MIFCSVLHGFQTNCLATVAKNEPSLLLPKVCTEVAPTLQFSPLVVCFWCVGWGSEMLTLKYLETCSGDFKTIIVFEPVNL